MIELEKPKLRLVYDEDAPHMPIDELKFELKKQAALIENLIEAINNLSSETEHLARINQLIAYCVSRNFPDKND